MNLPSLLNKYFVFLDRLGKPVNIASGLLCTLFLGLFDYLLDIAYGTNFSLDFFYLLPITFVAWFAGRGPGIAISLTCTAIKIIANPYIKIGHHSPLWENSTVLAFFLVIALLVAKLRQMLDYERNLSRTDHLTGVANTRAFLELLTSEIFRQQRHFQQRGHYHPFGLAYIDIDDFKNINDKFGHSSGDNVLKEVAATISNNLRRSDLVARLGGDEFAVLLPDTDATAGPTVMEKIRKQLGLSMQQIDMPVTFSIGLLTCPEPPDVADAVISFADNLMYEVKKNGKNSLCFAVYSKNSITPDIKA